MAKATECQSCGYVMNNRQIKCPYCGSGNPGYETGNSSASSKPFVQPSPAYFNNGNNARNTSYSAPQRKKFSVGIFILLLIFFPPLGIVYLIISTK